MWRTVITIKPININNVSLSSNKRFSYAKCCVINKMKVEKLYDLFYKV